MHKKKATSFNQLIKNNNNNNMKSDQTESVYKLAAYAATRILDNVLKGTNTINYHDGLSGSEIFADLKKGPTRDIVFNNLDIFDNCLNNLVFNRIEYLRAEGLVVVDKNQCCRIPTEAEMEEFLSIE